MKSKNTSSKRKLKNSDSRIWKTPLGYKLYLPLVILFFYLPIVSLIVFSFNETNSLINFTGFSFKWYKNLFHGPYNLYRGVWVGVNLILLAVMLALMVSGVLISRELFDFLPIAGGWTARRVHTAAAYWGTKPASSSGVQQTPGSPAEGFAIRGTEA